MSDYLMKKTRNEPKKRVTFLRFVGDEEQALHRVFFLRSGGLDFAVDKIKPHTKFSKHAITFSMI
jgi:hypothetical protein